MIDLAINEEQLKRTIERAKEKNIIIPTFEQMKNPELIPDKIKDNLRDVGLWDINSYNLFRITWKNDAVKKDNKTGRAQSIVPLHLNPNFFNAILDTQYAIRITIYFTRYEPRLPRNDIFFIKVCQRTVP